MRIFKLMLMCSVLPFLSGCLTNYTVQAVNKPTTRTLHDCVDHIERAVISNDNQLLIFLDGCLTNSWRKSRFTLAVSLAQIQTNTSINSLGTLKYGTLNVSRNAIHADWMPEKMSVDILKTVPVAPPIRQSGSLGEWPGAYAKSAKLLPNTTQTLYPIAEYDRDDCKAMEFIYVDTTTKQAYTVIYVDQVTVTTEKHRGYYCVLPLTVPLDVATAPLQVIGFGIAVWIIATHPQ
jgi:hypothetical protein